MIGPLEDAITMADTRDHHHRSISAINSRIASFLCSLRSIPGVRVEYRAEEEGTSHFFDLSVELSQNAAVAAAAQDEAEVATLLPAASASADKPARRPRKQSPGDQVRAMDKSGRTGKEADHGQALTVPQKEQAPTPAPSVITQRPFAAAPAFGASLDPLQAAHDHLNQVRDPAWTERQDLVLIERLSCGFKLGHIAQELDKHFDLVKSRFLVLCPRPSIENQALLLKALLQRVAADRADAEIPA